MTGLKILVAEDDPEIRTALERILRFEGYEVESANDGAAALHLVEEFGPDLAVLDVMMPFVDGLDVTRRLRAKGNQLPILILTAREETKDRVAGLDAGADDYMPKPFELDELLARIRALLRRAGANDENVVSVGDLTLDPKSYEVRRSGELLELTRTEFDILHLLMRNAGIVLERGVMYERIWGYDFGADSRSLDVHVGYLRRKLEDGGRERVIETVRGIGFVIRSSGS